jgi:hypothetical protein
MEEIEVVIEPVGKEERLAALIEGASAHYGLQVRTKGTLLSRLPALALAQAGRARHPGGHALASREKGLVLGTSRATCCVDRRDPTAYQSVVVNRVKVRTRILG